MVLTGATILFLEPRRVGSGTDIRSQTGIAVHRIWRLMFGVAVITDVSEIASIGDFEFEEGV